MNCKGNNDNSYSSKESVPDIKIFVLLIIMIILLLMVIKIIVILFWGLVITKVMAVHTLIIQL